jgi:hypothetical protein
MARYLGGSGGRARLARDDGSSRILVDSGAYSDEAIAQRVLESGDPDGVVRIAHLPFVPGETRLALIEMCNRAGKGADALKALWDSFGPNLGAVAELRWDAFLASLQIAPGSPTSQASTPWRSASRTTSGRRPTAACAPGPTSSTSVRAGVAQRRRRRPHPARLHRRGDRPHLDPDRKTATG